MRRLLLILWRIANYPIGAFGLFQMLDAANEMSGIDDYGYQYSVDVGFGTYMRLVLGICVAVLAVFSASRNKECRAKSSS